jgi:hypothetical protein
MMEKYVCVYRTGRRAHKRVEEKIILLISIFVHSFFGFRTERGEAGANKTTHNAFFGGILFRYRSQKQHTHVAIVKDFTTFSLFLTRKLLKN